MTVDKKKLQAGLRKLRGLEFEQAEAQAYEPDKPTVNITFSHKFQAALAAIALEVPYEDVRELPVREYRDVTQEVFNFLYSNSEEKTAVENSEV